MALDPQIADKYEILDKLREGGMGAIYKVRHRLLDEVRVVKVIRATDPSPEACERFLREARAAIRLRHPNVAVLYDFAAAANGDAFIVMEFIPGRSLLEVLQVYGPPPLSLTLEIARQGLKALGYLHRQRMLHRDVSPDNLMLTRDVDNQPLVKLIDLGIAKPLGEENTPGLTNRGAFLGKPRYAAPERFGDRGPSPLSDLYSFGIVLYELLTGYYPIRGHDAASYMAGHLFHEPIRFSESDPSALVPEDLRAIVLQSLAKRPEDRPADAEAFARALSRIQERYVLTAAEREDVFGVVLPLPLSRNDPTTEPGLLRGPLLPDQANQPVRKSGRRPDPTTTRTPILGALRRKPRTGDEKIVTGAAAALTWDAQPLRASGSAPAVEVVEAVEEKVPPRRPALLAAGLVLAAVVGGVGWRWQLTRAAPGGADGGSPRTETVEAPIDVQPAPTIDPETDPQTPSRRAPPSPTGGATETQEVRSPPFHEPPPEPLPTEGVLQPGTDISPPVPLELVPFPYPEAARGSGRQVTVKVALLIDETGQVLDVRLREKGPPGLGFDEIALDAARRTRFQPAYHGELSGRMWTELIFDFEE